MKKIILTHFFTAAALLVTGAASAQQLLKLNYKTREINQAGANIKKAEVEIAKCLGTMDSIKKTASYKEAVSLADAQAFAEELVEMDSLQKAKKDAEEDTAPFSLDNYTSFLGNFSNITVLPSVNFQVDKVYNTNGKLPGVHSFKLFAAGTQTAKDSLGYSLPLLFVESSKFGIQYSLLKVLMRGKENKADPGAYRPAKLSYLFEGNYLGKGLLDTVRNSKDPVKLDSISFTPHILHLKSGFEFAIVPEHISVYANANCIIPLTKREEFKQAFHSTKHQYFFADIGFVTQIELLDGGKKPEMNMYFSFGTIINNGDLRGLNGNNRDAVLPYFRLGLNTSLRKFSSH